MSIQFGENPYKVLGIDQGAGEAEIKQAYFTLVRKHSPERDPEGFKRIRAAYEKLRAGKERAETDLFLIDDQAITLDPSSIRRLDVEPSPISIEMIKSDLIAFEAILLLDQLNARATSSDN